MKKMKILLAWIEQVLQFDDTEALGEYVRKMTEKPYPFKIMSTRTDADGKVYVTVRKGYNNNQFPD